MYTWRFPAAIAAAALFASIVLATAVLVPSPSGDDPAPRIADEVLTNHLKIHVPDVAVASIEQVGDLLDRLDFRPVPSARIDMSSLRLVGARYCTLQGAIATQLLMVDTHGNPVTHYQAAFEPARFGRLPQREAGDELLGLTRSGLRIEIWVESGITMAKARSVGTPGVPGPLPELSSTGRLRLNWRPAHLRAVITMSSSLQEQLLKAGLVKKDKAQQAARQKAKRRKSGGGKGHAGDDARARQQKAAAEQAERDRKLAAERNARARERELQAQVRQLIEAHGVERRGYEPYAFTDGSVVRKLRIDAAQRAQIANGALIIVRLGNSYELIPRAAAERVRERAPDLIVLDHGVADDTSADDVVEGYEGYEIPDDLTW